MTHTNPPAQSDEYVAARQAAWKAQDAFETAAMNELLRMIPDNAEAITLTINDTPRLTVTGLIDANGNEVEMDDGWWDAADSIATELDVHDDDHASNFLFRHAKGDPTFGVAYVITRGDHYA